MNHVIHIPYGFSDATVWVLVALALFIAFLFFLGVPGKVAKALDDRSDSIKRELDEAAALREKAQELLASFQRRQRRAEQEAQAIIDQARADADRMAEEMRADLRDQLERRLAMAERKIAQAEADAMADVRRRAADIAAAAAESVLSAQMDAASQDRLIAESVEELSGRFS